VNRRENLEKKRKRFRRGSAKTRKKGDESAAQSEGVTRFQLSGKKGRRSIKEKDHRKSENKEDGDYFGGLCNDLKMGTDAT